MRCHYEVLGIERDADNTEIKRSYRKLALQTHPDKHPDEHDHYTALFREIQSAYEVLIDPQERAFYDKHREAILRGGDDYVDDALDLMHYFNPGVYHGFGDDEHGFYAVYADAFRKIAAEDEPFVDDEEELFIPDFGNSSSSFEDTVKPFYSFWLGYCTQKSYVWLDKYDIRQAPNRPTQRLMEKENKKFRDAAKKKRNEEIRALAAFVRKRDKRVHEYRRQLEQKQKEQKETLEKKKAEHKKEQKKKMENYQEQDWMAFENMKDQLKNIESHFDEQFGGDSDGSDSADESVDHFYCVACDKLFKSEKALANHEKSKKHKENVVLIKNEMEDDLLQDLHIEDEIDLDALLKEEEEDMEALNENPPVPKDYQRISSLNLPETVVRKSVIETVEGEPTFEEYTEGMEEDMFGDCADSIRLAKQRKPVRQSSRDYKEKKKKNRKADLDSAGDQFDYDQPKDLFARDSLALPRKKTSKGKQLRQQAEERRRGELAESIGFMDASLGESSVCDSLKITKKRGSKGGKKSKRNKSMDDIDEGCLSEESKSGSEDWRPPAGDRDSTLSDSGEFPASTEGDKSANHIPRSDSDYVLVGEEDCNLAEPHLGHSLIMDSIRIGKGKMDYHGKAKLKKQKSEEHDDELDINDSGKGRSSSFTAKFGIKKKNSTGEFVTPELFKCSVCGKDYPTRNKLFQHIKAEGHAALKEDNVSSKKSKSRKK